MPLGGGGGSRERLLQKFCFSKRGPAILGQCGHYAVPPSHFEISFASLSRRRSASALHTRRSLPISPVSGCERIYPFAPRTYRGTGISCKIGGSGRSVRMSWRVLFCLRKATHSMNDDESFVHGDNSVWAKLSWLPLTVESNRFVVDIVCHFFVLSSVGCFQRAHRLRSFLLEDSEPNRLLMSVFQIEPGGTLVRRYRGDRQLWDAHSRSRRG